MIERIEDHKLKRCPLCGNKPPKDLIDTLYPTGTVWREIPEEDGLRSYHSFKEMQEGDQHCYRMGCDVVNGGCGVSVRADSKEEAIEAWNRRPKWSILKWLKRYWNALVRKING